MCGVKTNIVTAGEVTETAAHDAQFFAPLVGTTAREFDVQEVSADKAYLSRKNLHTVEDVGGTAYIPFKSNSLPSPHNGQNGTACGKEPITSTSFTGLSSWASITSDPTWRPPSR